MKVDLWITRGEALTLEVDMAFVTLVYDIEEICKLTLKYMDDFAEIVEVEEDEDRMKIYDLNLDSLRDKDIYDLLHDLINYHDLKPIEII